MPLICKELVDLLDISNTSALNHSSLSNYAFLYGVFPTAPSVALYAVYYNAELEVVSCFHPLVHHSRLQTAPFFVSYPRRFDFCFLTGSVWDGDQHFPLRSNNVRFCLVTDDALDGPSAFDEFAADRQL